MSVKDTCSLPGRWIGALALALAAGLPATALAQDVGLRAPLTPGSMFVGTDSASVVVNPANLTVRNDNAISFGLVRGFGGDSEHRGTFESFIAPSFSLAAAQTEHEWQDAERGVTRQGSRAFSAQAAHALTRWLSLGVGARLAKVEERASLAPEDDVDGVDWTVDAGALLRLASDRLRIDASVDNLRAARLGDQPLHPTAQLRAQWVSPTGLSLGAGATAALPDWGRDGLGPTALLVGMEDRFLDDRLRLRAGLSRVVDGGDAQRLSMGLGYGFGAVGESANKPMLRTLVRLLSGLHIDYAVVFERVGAGDGDPAVPASNRQVVSLGKHF